MHTTQEFDAATQNADCLSGRLTSNERFSSRDLNEWIMSFITLRSGERLLDVCCGTGKQLLQYRRAVGAEGEVHGFDASAEALETIRRTVPAEGACVVLHHGQMESIGSILSGLEGSFDTVTCTYGLYYSKDVPRTVADIYRLLAPGGRLVVVGPARRNNESFYGLVGQVSEIPEFVVWSSTTFMDDLLIPECRKLFESVEIHEFENEVVYPDVETVVTYWKSCGTYYDESALPRFREIAGEHIATHGDFRNVKQAVGVVARKSTEQVPQGR